MPDKYFNRLAPPPATSSGGAASGNQNPARAPTQALARDAFGREIPERQSPSPFGPEAGSPQPRAKKKETATDALGRRAGALADELDFPAFVSSLVHGTFDAIVDSSIRQMEAHADLVSAVSKPLDQFAQENVTLNQARDWLVEQYPADVGLVEESGDFVLAPVVRNDEDFADAPSWLADFGQEGEPLSRELLEQSVLPVAREQVAQQRLSSLATMVLLGMQRVVVKDGTIGARLRFRAAAADHTAIQYATSNDPDSGSTEWGRRGTGRPAVTKVSTVGVNVQSDSELKAELFGDVKINFASETVPLDRFMDEAQRTLLERHSRRLSPGQPLPPAQAAPPQPIQATQPIQPQPSAPQLPSPTPPVATEPVGGGSEQGGGA